MQLRKFPDIPFSTREEGGEFCPHPEEPRFRVLARGEGSFPCVVVKEFPAFPAHLKRRRSPQERREELQCRATIPRVPQVSQSIPGKTVFPYTASNFKPRIDSHHGGKWDRHVGKPRGKATDPLIHTKGSVTLLLQVGRKGHVHAPTRVED